AHHQDVRVIELVGTLSLSNVDYVSRQLASGPRPEFLILDLRRVGTVTQPGARLLAEEFQELASFGVTVVLSGIDRASAQWNSIFEWAAGLSNLRNYPLLDDAIEWAEDRIVYRNGGTIDAMEMTDLSEQPLLAELTARELDQLATLGTVRTYRPGERIIRAGEPATSIFFLNSGVVHVGAPSGMRLATITAGMTFGEMALLEKQRAADFYADAAVTALEVPLCDFERFRGENPRIAEKIMRNLARLLADRLILANAKVDLLTAT